MFSWANDDDWSGDVFVWTANGRPQVIGCILSGPGKTERPAYHEFHTLSPEPLGPAEMTAKYRGSQRPASSSRSSKAPRPQRPRAGCLRCVRISRDLQAFMEADGKWELRLLPQPLLRYQPAEGRVIDGALFTWVWTKGTDPELIVAVECHRTDKGLEWRYAPVRFSNRELWLKHGDKEIWRVPVHREEGNDHYTGVYTTRYAGTIIVPRPK